MAKLIESRWGDYLISTDLGRLDIDVIHGFLRGSYWAQGIPREIVERSLRNSLCFGAYYCGRMAGFARVVTDYATFAYVADVFVLEPWRGHGLGRALMTEVMRHPDLRNLRRWLLSTRDAHGLYQRFGFTAPGFPERQMERSDPGIYARLAKSTKQESLRGI
jgi:GNAT superfamily N-acetyltransferase